MPLRTNGVELRKRRELKGMTQVEFAEATGYTATHVSQVELGNSNGSLRYVRTAARILECKIGDITNGELPRRRPTKPAAVAG